MAMLRKSPKCTEGKYICSEQHRRLVVPAMASNIWHVKRKKEHPSAAQFIMNDFHVDDRLTSVESAQQAKDLIQ